MFVFLVISIIISTSVNATTNIKGRLDAVDKASGFILSGVFVLGETGFVIDGSDAGESDFYTYKIVFGEIRIGDEIFGISDDVTGTWAPFSDFFSVKGSNANSSFSMASNFFGIPGRGPIARVNFSTPDVGSGLFDSQELSEGFFRSGSNILTISFIPEPSIWMNLIVGFLLTGLAVRGACNKEVRCKLKSVTRP
jgi:hypothetical protein